MTTTAELKKLIEMAEMRGASVVATLDEQAMINEGREIFDTIQISGLKGCGPYPMSPIAAAEKLRQLTGGQL